MCFELVCGLVWELGVFLLPWWIIALDGAMSEVPFLGHIYRGVNITPAGSIVGLIWAIIDGAIDGAIFALLYNSIAGHSLNTKEM